MEKTEFQTDLLLQMAFAGIKGRLEDMQKRGELSKNYFELASAEVPRNLEEWLSDEAIDALSPNLRLGIKDAIEAERWDDLINTFVRKVKFGTGGIRSMMAFDRYSILAMDREGIDARILKGPNTINNVVIMTCAFGVGRYLMDRARREGASEPKVVVGFDSRIQGEAFGRVVAEVLLASGLKVYLFDEPVPYPEVTFAIPFLNADVGIFISASHNDYRYNGFKLSGANGAQIPQNDRNAIVSEHILKTRPSQIERIPLDEVPTDPERLVFLGGSAPLPGIDYFGRGDRILDIHSAHAKHVKSFVLRKGIFSSDEGSSLSVAFAAFNGSGRRAVPRLMKELGVTRVHSIRSLDPLNGLFPAFKSEPGEEQQPDPGDPRAALIALRELQKDQVDWEDFDLMIGTDPDADRCGVILKPPVELSAVATSYSFPRFGRRHVLAPADDIWSLLLWYRMEHQLHEEGEGFDASRSFLVMSHTTSDMIAAVGRSYGIGVLKTWVGFGWLSNGVAEVWRGEGLPKVKRGRESDDAHRCHPVFFDTLEMKPDMAVNVAALEQSNGFSILGAPPDGFPEADRAMGTGGHVRDKDGTFAALLVTELAAYAKGRGEDLLSLLADRIYANPAVGLYVNYYEPDPLDGEYPGLAGDAKKKAILDRCSELLDQANGKGLALGGREVTSAEVYWTGKYDEGNWEGFPDEGIRFFFSSEEDHLTVRPSGTGNSLRFHVQLRGSPISAPMAWARRLQLELEAKEIVDDLRNRVGAPRVVGQAY
jgi:phosphomannomutase